MKRFSDIFFRQGKILRLDFLDYKDFNSFDTATDEIIKKFYIDLKALTVKDNNLEAKISANYAKIKTYETEEQSELIGQQLECERQNEYINVYLNSLLEMKIVYLFKSLELSIKYLIKTAYPDMDTKSLFKWESIKDFFKSRGIDISKIDGYQECVDLKKINNCIKHNGSINEEIQSILEFKGQSYLEHRQLETFYKRINQKVKVFCITLKEEIKTDLYVFSNERLTKLTEDFYERMDDKTIEEFIEKLNTKLKKPLANNSSNVKHL